MPACIIRMYYRGQKEGRIRPRVLRDEKKEKLNASEEDAVREGE